VHLLHDKYDELQLSYAGEKLDDSSRLTDLVSSPRRCVFLCLA